MSNTPPTRTQAESQRNARRWARPAIATLALLAALTLAAWWANQNAGKPVDQVQGPVASTQTDHAASARQLISHAVNNQSDKHRLTPGTEHPATYADTDRPVGYGERMHREVGESGIRLMARITELYHTPDITEEQRQELKNTLLEAAAVAREDGNILEWAIPTTMIAGTNLIYDIDTETSLEQLLAVASEPAVPPTIRLNALDSVADTLTAQLLRNPTFDPAVAYRALDTLNLSLDLIDRIDPNLNAFSGLYADAWKRRGDILAAKRDAEGATAAWLTLVEGPHARLVPTEIRAEAYKDLADMASDTGDYATATQHIANAIQNIPAQARTREFPVLLETLRFQQTHGNATVNATPRQTTELLALWRREDLAQYPSHLQIGTHTAHALRSVDPAEALIVYEEVLQRSRQLLENSTPGSIEHIRAQRTLDHATRERILLYATTPNHFIADVMPLDVMRDKAIDYLNNHPNVHDWERRLLEDNIIFK